MFLKVISVFFLCVWLALASVEISTDYMKKFVQYLHLHHDYWNENIFCKLLCKGPSYNFYYYREPALAWGFHIKNIHIFRIKIIIHLLYLKKRSCTDEDPAAVKAPSAVPGRDRDAGGSIPCEERLLKRSLTISIPATYSFIWNQSNRLGCRTSISYRYFYLKTFEERFEVTSWPLKHHGASGLKTRFPHTRGLLLKPNCWIHCGDWCLLK